MQLKTIALSYQEYESSDQLAEEDRQLLEEARKSLAKSYAPYSKFEVGAAIRLANGEIFGGANFENAAYPMCLCAERVALAAGAVAYPEEAVAAIAITVRNEAQKIDLPGAPCGACRQVLSEYENKGGQAIRVILQGEIGPVYCFDTIQTLLPLSFSGKMLPAK